MSDNGNTNARQQLRATLLRRWVMTMRPDIIKAIEAEVDAQLPKKGFRGKATPLPKSLAALK